MLRDGEDTLEERAPDAAVAVARPHVDVLDLDIRFLRRDDLHRLVAAHRCVNVADERTVVLFEVVINLSLGGPVLMDLQRQGQHVPV